MSRLVSTVTLRGGVEIPQVGLGVFQVPADQAQQVVEEALAVGYRHVDTAAAYVNESGVGAALRAAGVPPGRGHRGRRRRGRVREPGGLGVPRLAACRRLHVLIDT